jgi:ATP-dependent DNA helicase RecG
VRPSVLNPLFAGVQSLPGIGPRTAKLFAKAAGERVIDLVWHLPVAVIDRRRMPGAAHAAAGEIASFLITIDEHQAPRSASRPYRIRTHDETGALDLVFFHVKGDYLAQQFPPGQQRIVSGRVELYGGLRQLPHPDLVARPDERDKVLRIEPVYPLTANITLRMMSKAVQAAVDRAPDLLEWLDAEQVRQQKWPDWRSAIHALHAPKSEADLSPETKARQRLAADEFLAGQLALALGRRAMRSVGGAVCKGDGALRAKMRAALPFAFTGAQETAIAEIEQDMAQPIRMLRLLQGDVGSGKTLVAWVAMLNAIEAGHQAALMAPTELLARQHFATLQSYAEKIGLTVAVLTGREKAKARVDALQGLADGSIRAVVGTHALFQDEVEFRSLALAVIDEQHRFGVHQRLLLTGKSKDCDVLVMTATPIPRTLTLTAYGDMEVSRLTEKPKGRQSIDTRVVSDDRYEELVEGIGRQVDSGAQVYWVCPLVTESEEVDLAAAEERAVELRARFGDRVGLVHGQMRAGERDAAMEAFREGRTRLLVATTVIEVGVDVPNATVIVIEHAERFGLAQLHQLRGRVGRGEKPSVCILLASGPLGETARARLQIMRQTDVGFRIAEEDLRLRGAGDLLGTRQSGLADYHVADLAAHGDLLIAAQQDTKRILESDPELRTPRGQALRVLLYLFERDAAIRLLRSG